MWRSLNNLQKNSTVKAAQLFYAKSQIRHQSSTKKGGKAGKVLFTVLGTSILGTTGIIVAASYEKKFRNLLEENIPPIKPFLEFCLDHPPQQPTPKSLAKIPTISKPISNNAQEKPAAPSTRPDTSSATRKDLRDNWEQLEKLSKEAIKLHREALIAIQEFKDSLKTTLDKFGQSEEEDALNELTKKISHRNSLINNANAKSKDVKSSFEKLSPKLSSLSPLERKQYDSKISKCMNDLRETEDKVLSFNHEKELVENYATSIQHGMDLYTKELEVLLPGINLKNIKSLNQDQFDVIIAFIGQKLNRYNNLMSQLKVHEHLAVEKALETEKQKNVDNLNKEMKKLKEFYAKKLEEENEHNIDQVNEIIELELRKQLSRMASVFNETMLLSLSQQQKELLVKYQDLIDEKLHDQKKVFNLSLDDAYDRLNIIDLDLSKKEELYATAQKVQKIYVAAQNLSQILENASAGGDLVKVNKELQIIEQVSADKNPVINILLDSIPKSVYEKGIFTELDLKERYKQIEKLSQRTAFVEEGKTGLYFYIISYMYSFFVTNIDYKNLAELEDPSIKICPALWNNQEILDRIRYCLKHSNYEQALRYASQLKGKPKELFSNWIKEVKDMTETKQAVNSIINYTSSVNIQAC